MAPDVKFCGLTRPEDAAAAARLGAAYAGVIFAGGPRHLDEGRATEVLAALPEGVGRVGVFAAQPPEVVAATAAAVGLTVVQLHAPRPAAELRAVRRMVGADVWAVVRVAGAALPDDFDEIAGEADAVVVDALAPGQLGGTGATVDWTGLAAAFARGGRPARLILAGGLRPGNVTAAVAALAPAVVDVSSGVESSPGIKDHARMAAFAAAVATPFSDLRQSA